LEHLSWTDSRNDQRLRQGIIESHALKGYQHPTWCSSVEYLLLQYCSPDLWHWLCNWSRQM